MNQTANNFNVDDDFGVRKHTVRVLTPQEVDQVGGGLAKTWVYTTIVVATTIMCTVAASLDGTETATVTVEA